MDNYEKLLEEKIENAKRDWESLGMWRNSFDKGHRLQGEIEAYQDALNEYRRLKNG